MKTNQITTVLFVLLSLTLSAQDEDLDATVERVEKNTRPFSTDYFNRAENSFYVISLKVENREIVVNQESEIKEVPGRFPHPAGDMNVRVTDVQGNLIADYTMLNPLVVRSCDEGEGTTTLNDGLLQLALPKSDAIAGIELVMSEQEVYKVDIRPVMERFLRGDGGEDENGDDGEDNDKK